MKTKIKVKATAGGCVIDASGCVIYDSQTPEMAKEIANAINKIQLTDWDSVSNYIENNNHPQRGRTA